MSRVAIFEGLGRRRKHRLGKHRRSTRRHVSSYGKRRGKRGGATAARRKFAAAARSCKIVFRGAGTATARRRKFNTCIKNYLRSR